MEENFQNDGTQINTEEGGGSNYVDKSNLGDSTGSSNVNNNADTDNLGGRDGSVFDIPQEYKEKDWVKNFEGKTGNELRDEVFKALNEKYTNSPIVPQTAEEYALNELEFKDEQGNITYQYPEEVLGYFGSEFKELGLTKEQAHGLLTKYTNFELEQFRAMTDIEDLNKNLDEMFKSNPAQKQTVQSLLKEFLPKEDQEFLQTSAPNYTIEMFYKVAKGLVDKYGYKEGAGGQGGQNNFRMSQADKDREYERIVSKMEELTRRPHTSEEKEILQKELNALFRI